MMYGLAALLAVMVVELWLLRRRVGVRLGALSKLEDDLESRRLIETFRRLMP